MSSCWARRADHDACVQSVPSWPRGVRNHFLFRSPKYKPINFIFSFCVFSWKKNKIRTLDWVEAWTEDFEISVVAVDHGRPPLATPITVQFQVRGGRLLEYSDIKHMMSIPYEEIEIQISQDLRSRKILIPPPPLFKVQSRAAFPSLDKTTNFSIPVTLQPKEKFLSLLKQYSSQSLDQGSKIVNFGI